MKTLNFNYIGFFGAINMAFIYIIWYVIKSPRSRSKPFPRLFIEEKPVYGCANDSYELLTKNWEKVLLQTNEKNTWIGRCILFVAAGFLDSAVSLERAKRRAWVVSSSISNAACQLIDAELLLFMSNAFVKECSSTSESLASSPLSWSSFLSTDII